MAGAMPLPIDLLISGGTAVTCDGAERVVSNAAIAVQGESIVEIGAREEIEARYTPARRIDAAGMLVFPGLVDTHTHLYQTLLKGLGDDLPLMEDRKSVVWERV